MYLVSHQEFSLWEHWERWSCRLKELENENKIDELEIMQNESLKLNAENFEAENINFKRVCWTNQVFV